MPPEAWLWYLGSSEHTWSVHTEVFAPALLYSEFLLQFLLLLCSKETEMPPLKQRLIHYLSTPAFPLARGSG